MTNKTICKFKMNWCYRYGSKNLTKRLARVYEKDIDDDYDIDWEV